MAEGGVVEEQRRARQVRLMCPHPPRPFQAYSGPPVAEGQLIASLSVTGLELTNGVNLKVPMPTCKSNDAIMFRVDCAFDPYCEQWIAASVDMHVLVGEARLVSLDSQNEGHLTLMSRLSVLHGERIGMPYRRSEKSASTAFCSDGNRIGWPATVFNVYDRSQNMRRIVSNTFGVSCGAFSPDGRHLALLTTEDDLLVLEIIDSRSFVKVADGFCFTGFFPEAHFDDNPVHLLWSKCGRFLGLSTYFGELIVFKVELMMDAEAWNHGPIPQFPHHEDFEKIAHPQAYDFASRKSERGEEITIMALGTVHNSVRLFDVSRDGIELISRVEVHENYLRDRQFTRSDCAINCLRFSNAQDLLAVALSNGAVDLLRSVSLLPFRVLQPAMFRMQHQPQAMPFVRGFSSLAFACSDNFLAAGATDDRVRVWCLRRPTGPLKALCRTAIRSRCKLDDLCELPLPDVLLDFLTDLAFA